MHAAEHTLIDRTARAARWRAAGAGVVAVSQFGIGVLLARLLAPADFGVMAIAFVVLGLARPLGDLGIGGAIVQRADLTDRHLRTGFTLSTIWGLTTAAVIVAAAPLAAVVMRDPRVTPVLRVLAIGFALGGTAVVAGALLRRTLDFKTQFFIDTGSYALGYGGVASTMALLGYGVWSLVCGGLAQTFLASAAQLAASRHALRPLLGRRELADLLRFGVGAAMSGWVNYVALNGDNFVVGRWIGAASLGLYSRAYALMNLPYTYAAAVMTSVLVPAFAEAQGDPARLRRGYLLTTRVVAMIAAPAMGTLAIAAPHLVRSVYGARWIGVVAPLQILCAAGYFRALYHLGGVVAQSVGWVYSELWRQAIYAALVIGGALVGSRYGLGGVATGVGAAILYMFFASAQLALRATGTSWRAYFRVQIAGLVTAAAASGVAVAVRQSLETWQAPSGTIALAVIAAAAVPWSIGLLWNLGEPDLDPLRARLPVSCVRLAGAMAGWRRR
jgi:PST family polysaccharide transporter